MNDATPPLGAQTPTFESWESLAKRLDKELAEHKESHAQLVHHNEKLREALLDMIRLATQEGWNTPLYLPEFGNVLKAARLTLNPPTSK